MRSIALQTLGSLDLRTDDGRELTSLLAQPKRFAVLTYLAVATPRGFHRRDTLLGVFWPDVSQTRARGSLRQALHFVRQTLGADIVVSRGTEEVGLSFDDVRCDAVEFETHLNDGQLEGAVESYAGPFLQGFGLGDAPEFERWLDGERDRLARLYARALETLANEAMRGGDLERSVEWWSRLARHDEYNSQVAISLTMALDRAGDRAGAIAHAEAHAAQLQQEWGVDPDETVLELADRLRHEPRRERLTLPDSATHVAAVVGEASDEFPEAQAANPEGRRGKKKKRRMLKTLAAAALVGTVAYGAYLNRPLQGTDLTDYKLSVSVLPFENLGNHEDAYFAQGLTEDLVGRLAGVRHLNVLRGFQTSSLEGWQPAIQSGSSQGSEFVLRVTVERVRLVDGRRRIRVTPVLARAVDGFQLWTDNIEVDEERVLDAQARVAENVARALGLSPWRTESEWLRSVPTDNLPAFDVYLRGSDYLSRDVRRAENFRAAVLLLERAATLDPQFAHAFAKLSIAHSSMYWWNYDRSVERLAKAKAAADEAMRLRSDLPISHLAQGWYYYWGKHDYDRALRHFQLVRTTWPGITDVIILLGAIRRRQGDFSAALAHHEELASVNPRCEACAAHKAFTHLMLRDYDRAQQEARSAIDVETISGYPRLIAAHAHVNESGDISTAWRLIAPTVNEERLIASASQHWWPLYRSLGQPYERVLMDLPLTPATSDTASYYLLRADVLGRLGHLELARRSYDSARTRLERRAEASPDDPWRLSALGLAYAGLGRAEAALEAGTAAVRLRQVSRDAVDGPVLLERLARIYLMTGAYDEAIDKLETLLSMPSMAAGNLLRLDPVWEPLREHQRFQRLVQ